MSFDDAWLLQQLQKPGYRLVHGTVPSRTPPPSAYTLPAGSTEAAMQDTLRSIAKGMGYLYYHTHDSRRSDPGMLDTAIIHPAQPATLYLLELKSAEGRVAPAQQRWLDALTRVTTVHTDVIVPGDWGHLIDLLTRGAPPRSGATDAPRPRA